MNHALAAEATRPPAAEAGATLRAFVIALIAFLTLVDLFAAQAILPILVRTYGVSPAAMGLAVNASTLGMAVAALGVGLLSRRIDRRSGILVSLALLAVPTALLAVAPDLTTFALLRIAQGLCMASAFTLTLAYLGERSSAQAAAGAFAAYVTGNVASNLFGRLMSAAIADQFGLASNFYIFAGLNLLGAALVFFTIQRTPPALAMESSPGHWTEHFQNRAVAAGFGIGFCILFAFIGTFTYVNFVLVRPPLALGMMSVGLIYFVFLPSMVLTPLAGAVVARLGTRPAVWIGLGAALIGLPLMLAPRLPLVLLGMVLVGAGTFFAQASTTGFISRAATGDRGSASGIYLACYFFGGLVGTAVLGQAFDRVGWAACVVGVGLALVAAALLTFRLRLPTSETSR